jgi:Lipase C-terminal domain/alpha/beta hydrolase fold
MRDHRIGSSLACLVSALLCTALGADSKTAPWAGDVDAGADKSFRPIVFVHGFAGSGEQYEQPAKLFASNGYPPTWITNYDYNSTGADGGSAPLDKFIDAVRARTGFDKVDLVGHSRGTAVSQAYLADPKRAAKVAHYANIGGRAANNVGGVPTLVVGSKGDKLAGPGAAREGAKHVVLEKPDHVGVATGTESFEKVFIFFNDGKAPKTREMKPQEPIIVAGFAKVFGPNTPLAGAAVEVYEVAAETGRRSGGEPSATLTVGRDGAWGPFKAKGGQHYESCLTPAGGGTPAHYYREPFERSDLLVYLKTRDDKSEPGATMTRELHLSDDSSVIVVSSLNGAVIAGRDSLKVNGVELATGDIAPERGTKVAFFLFDANGNKKTDATHPNGASWSRPFITAADVYIPAGKPESVKLELNGHVLHVPNWKAASEGQIVVAFNGSN